MTAVLQCLFVVVEDNPLAMQKTKSNCERQLQALLSLESLEPGNLLIKTLSAGVIINICGGNVTVLPIDVINQIMTILGVTLSIDHRLMSSQLSSQVPLSDGSSKIVAPKGKAAELLQSQIKSVSQMLDAQQTAIEIIANICSCEGKTETFCQLVSGKVLLEANSYSINIVTCSKLCRLVSPLQL